MVSWTKIDGWWGGKNVTVYKNAIKNMPENGVFR